MAQQQVFSIQRNESTTWLINKLKNDSNQYPPLNKEEERALIEKYRNDRDKLNELLYLHNIKLVFNTAKKYVLKTNDFDAFVSDLLFGLAEAVNRFDIDKNIKFSTYAMQWIFKYTFSDYFSKNHKVDYNCVSLDQVVSGSMSKAGNDSNGGNTYDNYINDFVDPSYSTPKTLTNEISESDQKHLYNNIINIINNDSELSATDKSIFFDTVVNGLSARTVAEKFHMEYYDITTIKKNILNKIRCILKRDYNINSIDDVLMD